MSHEALQDEEREEKGGNEDDDMVEAEGDGAVVVGRSVKKRKAKEIEWEQSWLSLTAANKAKTWLNEKNSFSKVK